MTTRLSVSLSDEVAADLKAIADKRGQSAAQALTRAIAWYEFVETQVIEPGLEMRLRDNVTGEVFPVQVYP